MARIRPGAIKYLWTIIHFQEMSSKSCLDDCLYALKNNDENGIRFLFEHFGREASGAINKTTEANQDVAAHKDSHDFGTEIYIPFAVKEDNKCITLR